MKMYKDNEVVEAITYYDMKQFEAQGYTREKPIVKKKKVKPDGNK